MLGRADSFFFFSSEPKEPRAGAGPIWQKLRRVDRTFPFLRVWTSGRCWDDLTEIVESGPHVSFSSGLNLGQMLGRADSIFLSFFSPFFFAIFFFFGIFAAAALPYLSSPLLSSSLLNTIPKGWTFQILSKCPVVDNSFFMSFQIQYDCAMCVWSKHAPKIGPFFGNTYSKSTLMSKSRH